MALIHPRSLDDKKYTPTDLIIQESVKHLITSVQSLERRCVSLEAERDTLHATVTELKEQHAGCNSAGDAPRDLSGYALSECSDVEVSEHTSKRDVDTLTDKFDQKMSAAEQILRIVRDKLQTEVEERKAVQKSCSDGTKALEVDLAALRVELRDQRTDSWGAKTNAKKESTPVTPPGTNDKEGDAGISLLAKEVSNLRKMMRLRAKQHAKIDDCPTRESLYELYHILNDDLITNEADDRSVQFEGDLDELWHLRDRVVTRLAMFDLYGEAMKEAKKTDRGI